MLSDDWVMHQMYCYSQKMRPKSSQTFFLILAFVSPIDRRNLLVKWFLFAVEFFHFFGGKHFFSKSKKFSSPFKKVNRNIGVFCV